jgi:hypothetical protein
MRHVLSINGDVLSITRHVRNINGDVRNINGDVLSFSDRQEIIGSVISVVLVDPKIRPEKHFRANPGKSSSLDSDLF